MASSLPSAGCIVLAHSPSPYHLPLGEGVKQMVSPDVPRASYRGGQPYINRIQDFGTFPEVP